ncbi:IclR family transcriptional regulator [Mycobacteroides abscessus]|uniref:IclR family transcriptional regulator n=1 Tax=Mycobacteroides abscessus TaxID=36809 RepID=UPI00355B1CF0
MYHKSTSALSSLDRGLRILTFIQDRGQVDIAEIIEQLCIPSSSTYRYIRVLQQAGFITEIDGKVLSTDRLTDPSSRGSDHLVSIARPILTRLGHESGLNVVLSVRVHTAALCLDARRSGLGSVGFHPGEILALYAGASATPLLAMAPQSVQQQVLSADMHRYTAATPDAATLASELAGVRRRGYHVTHGWLTPGMTSVGVPLIVGGTCLCALSLVGPHRALTDSTAPLTLLNGAIAEIGTRLPRALSTAWTPPDERIGR